MNNYYYIIISLCFQGIANSFVDIPIMFILIDYVIKFDSSLDNYSSRIVSFRFYIVFKYLGYFIGPIIGDYFVVNYEFYFCSLFLTLIIVCYLTIFLFYFYQDIKSTIFSGDSTSKNLPIFIDLQEKEAIKNIENVNEYQTI